MYKIVAVMACPTGIAHTVMAAEALEKTAKAMGHTLQAEMQGSAGARNVLTEQEIREADADAQKPGSSMEPGFCLWKTYLTSSPAAAVSARPYALRSTPP